MIIMGRCLIITKNCLIALGFLLFCSSFLVNRYIHNKINTEVSKKLKLVPGNDFYSKWSNPPIPLMTSVYIFNVSNPTEVLKGKKPIVHQVGPFVFEAIITRNITGMSDDDNLISFVSKRRYFFRRDLSPACMLNEPIVTINIPVSLFLSGFVNKVSQLGFMAGIFYSRVNTLLTKTKESVFIHTTPEQYLMNGYNVGVFEHMKDLKLPALPDPLPDPQFYVMKQRNITDSGLYTIYTGREDSHLTGKIFSWNNKTSFGCWKSDECNRMQGYEGAFFPPPINSDSDITIFSPTFQGSLKGQFSEQIKVDGVKKQRFLLLEDMMKAPTQNIENKCYCTRSYGDGSFDEGEEKFCSNDGILDIGSCQEKKVDLFLSKPHFYLGSELMRTQVDGLTPEKENHQSYMDIDPVLGLVTSMKMRTQLNVDFNKIKRLSKFKQLPDVMFPAVWFEDSVSTEGKVEAVRMVHATIRKVDLIVKLILFVGAVLMSIGCILWYKQIREESRMKKGDGDLKKAALMSKNGYPVHGLANGTNGHNNPGDDEDDEDKDENANPKLTETNRLLEQEIPTPSEVDDVPLDSMDIALQVVIKGNGTSTVPPSL